MINQECINQNGLIRMKISVERWRLVVAWFEVIFLMSCKRKRVDADDIEEEPRSSEPSSHSSDRDFIDDSYADDIDSDHVVITEADLLLEIMILKKVVNGLKEDVKQLKEKEKK